MQDGKDDPDDRSDGIGLRKAQSGCGVRFHFHLLILLILYHNIFWFRNARIWRSHLLYSPTVAIMQWRNEIEMHTTGMDVLVWHGALRITDPKELKKYDVVLTTYAVLESCFRKQQTGFKRKGAIIKETSSLHTVEWERVVVRGYAGLS